MRPQGGSMYLSAEKEKLSLGIRENVFSQHKTSHWIPFILGFKSFIETKANKNFFESAKLLRDQYLYVLHWDAWRL